MNHRGIYSLSIQTPEGVVFSLPLASPVVRFIAWLLDCACVLALLFVFGQIVSLVAVISGDVALGLNCVLFFVLQTGYGIACEWYWRGQALGKRLMHLRVMDQSGLRLQFSLISRRAQRLGDLAAGTVVVRTQKAVAPDVGAILAGKFNSFRTHPHLEARLRQAVSPEEAQWALRALLRRDGYLPQARVELFARMARHFKARVQFPPEITEDLADEQYVRNVVDSLFRVPSAASLSDRPDGLSVRSERSAGSAG